MCVNYESYKSFQFSNLYSCLVLVGVLMFTVFMLSCTNCRIHLLVNL